MSRGLGDHIKPLPRLGKDQNQIHGSGEIGERGDGPWLDCMGYSSLPQLELWKVTVPEIFFFFFFLRM